MSVEYTVFRSVREFVTYIEGAIKDLTEAESVIRNMAPKGGPINAINVELMINVMLDSREILGAIREAKEAYLRILSLIPNELRDVNWVVILELMGNRPVRAYIVPMSLSAETPSKPASAS